MLIASIPELTDAEVDAFISANTCVLLCFYAPWSPQSRHQEAMLMEVARAWAGRVETARLEIDECPEATAAYNILRIPAYVLLRRGVVVGQLAGAVTQQALEEFLAANT